MRKKMIILLISTCQSFVSGYRSLIRSKSHIKVKVISRSEKNIYTPSNFYVAHIVSKWVV